MIPKNGTSAANTGESCRRRRVAGGVCLMPVAGWALIVGCARPMPNGRSEGPSPDAAGSGEPVAAGVHLIALSPAPIRPGCVGLSDELARRHGIHPRFDPHPDSGTVFYEGFNQSHTPEEINWLRIGNPDLEIGSSSGNSFLRVSSPSGSDVPVGLSRQLNPARLAGRPVLYQVWTRTVTPEPVERSSDSPVPARIRFMIQREGDRERSVEWPLAWEHSPGWELQRGVWFAPSDLLGVRLEISLTPGAEVLELDDFLIQEMHEGNALRDVSASNPGRWPSPGENILVGGDFETGRMGFGVLAYADAPTGPGSDSSAAGPGPAPWYFDRPGRVGATCLAIPLGSTHQLGQSNATFQSLSGNRIRLWLGPAPIRRPAGYVLSFWARATEPTGIEVSLWMGGVQSGPIAFEIEESWQQRSHTFLVMGPQVPDQGYVTIDARPSESRRPAGFWIDAVCLSPEVAPVEYQAPNRFEMGILGSTGDPLDVDWLFDQSADVEFSLRMVNYDQRPLVGRVNVDVVDALNRGVWCTDLPVSLAPRGNGSDSAQSSHRLRLGRGFYRILATAWLDDAGNGGPLSQQTQSLAVLNLSDPVPLGAPVGLPVAPARFSARISQWGVGWARVPMDIPHDGDNLAAWADLIRGCQRQNLEIIGEYTRDGNTELPLCIGRRCILPAERALQAITQDSGFLLGAGTEGADGSARPVIAVTDVGSVSTQLAKLFADRRPLPGDAIELHLPHAPLPEDLEPILERVRGQFPSNGDLRLWDCSIKPPLLPGLGDGWVPWDTGYEGRTMRVTLEPALEASELVRALAIRLWYGFDRVSLGTYPLLERDPAVRGDSEAETGLPVWVFSLAAPDHSPKPALAALDFACELLNDAAPAEWIDGYRGARAAAFDRGGDRGVVFLWRSFGLSPTWHRLIGLRRSVLAEDGEPTATLEIRNFCGQSATQVWDDSDLLVPVNAMVRCIIAEGPAWREVRRLLPFALGEPEPEKGN